jgi:hypothetical protein
MGDSVGDATLAGVIGEVLSQLTDDGVARAWASCMKELARRDLIRTANTPVGDYGERVACEMLGLERLGFSEKSIDAVDANGIRYQIKSRRITPQNPSRQLGAIRDIDSGPFDVLLAVFFDEDLTLTELWSIPCAVVAEAAFVERTNSTRFVLTQSLRADKRLTQLYPLSPTES